MDLRERDGGQKGPGPVSLGFDLCLWPGWCLETERRHQTKMPLPLSLARTRISLSSTEALCFPFIYSKRLTMQMYDVVAEFQLLYKRDPC